LRQFINSNSQLWFSPPDLTQTDLNHCLLHDIQILAWNLSSLIEGQPLLNLFSKLLPKYTGKPQAGMGLYPTSCQATTPRGRGKASNVADLESWSLCWAQGITQTPGLAITPIAEACTGQGALVNHHRDPQTSSGHQKWHLSVGRCPHWYLNRAFSAPRICTVDAGYLARLVRLPA
ncbi:hypothetical protein DBR06_SOUSAS28310006, partial [Sousa chinensis]